MSMNYFAEVNVYIGQGGKFTDPWWVDMASSSVKKEKKNGTTPKHRLKVWDKAHQACDSHHVFHLAALAQVLIFFSLFSINIFLTGRLASSAVSRLASHTA